jgi:DAACS family dicarboxylate/amino acid:cation (Na+ or H+) symporter/aerobic C4-dicarboxylate transport protein
VATVVVARWEGALDMNVARAMLNREGDTSVEALKPAGQLAGEPMAAQKPIVRPSAH